MVLAISALRQRIRDALLTISDTSESTFPPELFPSMENNDTIPKCFAVHIPSWELYSEQRQRGAQSEPLDIISKIEIGWAFPLSEDEPLTDLDSATDFEAEIVNKLVLTVGETTGLRLLVSTGERTTNSDASYISGVISLSALHQLY